MMKVTTLCLAVLTLLSNDINNGSVCGFAPSSSFTGRTTNLLSRTQNGTRMNMMFDQLSNAITNVAQSFGGRSKYVHPIQCHKY